MKTLLMQNESPKYSVLELESLREELIIKTLAASSNISEVYLLYTFFRKVLATQNPNLCEVFLKEFIEDYISSISRFDVWGIEPEKTKRILSQLIDMSELRIAADNASILKSEIERLEKQLEKLGKILEGQDYDKDEACPPLANGSYSGRPPNSTGARDKDKERTCQPLADKAFFPLIDTKAEEGFYGILESVTVKIGKAADQDKFIIVPSEKEIEKKILEQCKRSWFAALDLSREYIKKPYKHHEVIISFNKKDGFYEGNSLGTALTISFLEELLKFYNPTYIIKIKEQTAFTGGMTNEGKVLPTGEEIIRQKVNAVFFSEMNTFIVPKCEEAAAQSQLAKLTRTYTNRKLKIIPVEDISDVLNRRDVVDIRKQKLAVRTGKFVRKNWVSAVVTVLLAILFGYLFVVDWDDNPVTFSMDKQNVYIKNRNGKLLWVKNVPLGDLAGTLNYYPLQIKIVDINDDGRNEVLLVGEKADQRSIQCYDARGRVIWKYSFFDQVFSPKGDLGTEYGLKILDTLYFEGKKSVYLFSNNVQSFSSAIIRIDLKTGKRLAGTFWCSGHIVDGMIRDLTGDKKKDLIGIGYDNGYEDVALFGIQLDTLTKVRPTKQDYLIKGYPSAQMLTYIRFPKTDYDNYFKYRNLRIESGNFEYKDSQKQYRFATGTKVLDNFSKIGYEINDDFKNINIVIVGDFRVRRDSLVKHSELKPPYTDTEEYKELIKSRILFWKDGKWLKREELD